ncbi:MAG: hypothetical protein SOY33_05215 [Candidatus Onthovivens sp.]|nr:hypothetical protein [Bacilli bacterium]
MKKFNKFKAYISSVITLLVSSLVISFVAFTYAAYLNHEAHKHTINVNFDYKAYFGEGSDVNNKIYYISTPEHLRNLSKLVAIGTFTKDYTFILKNDIDFSSENDPLMPIGSDSTPFYSTFDGQNHSIINLMIVGLDVEDVGMFGYVANGATIKNYFLENPIVTARGTFEASSYSNDGFLNRSRNLLYQQFDKSSIDEISIVPNSFVTGTVNGVADSKIGFKKFSFTGLEAFSQYNPQIYISKSVVKSDNASPSYNSTFTLQTDLTESQYFTVEIYVEGLVVNDNGENYYSRYTLERFKIYLYVDKDDPNNKYFIYNPSDVNVYKKTIETEPTYSSVGSQTTFYYNRHVVYAGIVCGHLDGNAEYIGVINGTLKADNRPIRSNSILIGKRIEDDDVSNISKEHINFVDSITKTELSFINENGNGIEHSNKNVNNKYIDIYKKNNAMSTLSEDAEKFFRIYGSVDGSGVSLEKHTFTPTINDGDGNYIAETDENGNEITKEGNFVSLNKPLVCGLTDDAKSTLLNTYYGSKNYLQQNCISMWITKESSQENVLSTLFSQTGDFYLNFEFDYLFFDSKATDEDNDGVNESKIALTIKTVSKHNTYPLPQRKFLRHTFYYNYFSYTTDNPHFDFNDGNRYYEPWDVNDKSTSTNGILQFDSNKNDPRQFKDGVFNDKNSVKDSFPLVKHKTISIASNVRYFNTDNVAQRTPLFNIGLSVPSDYPSDGVYSLDLLNFTVTLTSTSGNVVGDPLTVDFLADKTTNIEYDSTSSTYSNWPNNSMVKVGTSCFSRFLAGTKGTDYNLVNGVFTYKPTANNGSYNTLIPGSGDNAFYVVSTRANNSKNNKNNVTITYYNSVSDGTNNNIPYNETGYTQANIKQGL